MLRDAPAPDPVSVAPRDIVSAAPIAGPAAPDAAAEPEARPDTQVAPQNTSRAATASEPRADPLAQVRAELPEAAVPAAALPRAERPRPRLAPAVADAADLAEARVIVRMGSDVAEVRRAEVLALLDASGVGSIEVQSVPFAVSRPRLGYFDPNDRGVAEALAALIAPAAGRIAVRSYDDLLAEPAPGRLDLWLGG